MSWQPIEGIQRLIEMCEAADEGSRELDIAIVTTLCPEAMVGEYAGYEDVVFHAEAIGIPNKEICPFFTTSIDAALTLLPPGADWRKLTNPSISVYAANPYNAAAQLRHDGNAATPPLQMCVAALRLKLHSLLKAKAIEARQGGGADAVHESAGRKASPIPTPETVNE